MEIVYIGLGSNLQSPIAQIQTALTALQSWSDITHLSYSSLYQSKPLGPTDQPDFINAVAKFHTSLAASDLLAQLQQLERRHKRVRYRHWGERTLDLDILLYGRQFINTQQLTVPHPELGWREFVLYPLSDIMSLDTDIPGWGVLSDLLAHCPKQSLQKL